MNIQLTDRTWNVVWECGICKKISADKNIILISMIVGLQPTPKGVGVNAQPIPVCPSCFKVHDLKAERPPKIHMPTPSDIVKVTRERK